MKEMEIRIVLATGQAVINKTVSENKTFKVVGTVEKRGDLLSSVKISNPDVVLVGEGLPGSGSLPDIILSSAGQNPYTRFVYLAGNIQTTDTVRIEPIKKLVRAGIYDIVHTGGISKAQLFHLLANPNSEKNVEYLLDKKIKPETEPVKVITSKTEPKEATVISFSSIKPGTGKSFLSANIATAIAQFSKVGDTGKKPRVALVDGDLQNVSLGTLFGLDDNESYLLRALNTVSSLMNKDGDLIVGPESIQDANDIILKSMTPYHHVKNLEILAGSNALYDDLIEIQGFHYSYLIEALKPHYDYIILDSNSSLSHNTTFPILHISDICYYVLNLDYNNVRNNIKYKENLKNWKVDHKVHYILNQDTEKVPGIKAIFKADDVENVGFKLDAKVPFMNVVEANNKITEGVPIVLEHTEGSYPVREPLLKIAMDIVDFHERKTPGGF